MFELNCSYVIHSNIIQKVIYSLNISNGLGIKNLKDICGYFQCAPFPRLQPGKVVWVLSFDP